MIGLRGMAADGHIVRYHNDIAHEYDSGRFDSLPLSLSTYAEEQRSVACRMSQSITKQLSHWMVSGRAFHRVAESLERQDGRAGRLRVLTYHRVLPAEEHFTSYPGLISATPDDFAEQVDFLAERYQVVSLDQVHRAVTSGVPLPPRAVLLTFDDAYEDFARYAWPVLRDRCLPVVLFVPTAYPDQPSRCFWWDRVFHACHHTDRTRLCGTSLGPLPLTDGDERAAASAKLNVLIKSRPHDEACELVERVWCELTPPPLRGNVLGWDALRRLRREGATLAAHTRTHPLLNRLPIESAVAEARGSHDDLQHQLGDTLPALAYPAGGHSRQLADELRKFFTLAFTTRRGINEVKSADPLRLCRINVGRQTSLPVLRAQLLSCAAIVHRYREGMLTA